MENLQPVNKLIHFILIDEKTFLALQSHLLMIGITSTLLLIKKIKSKEKSIVEKQTYSYEEAYEESLRYFQGDELAARVWVTNMQ